MKFVCFFAFASYKTVVLFTKLLLHSNYKLVDQKRMDVYLESLFCSNDEFVYLNHYALDCYSFTVSLSVRSCKLSNFVPPFFFKIGCLIPHKF